VSVLPSSSEKPRYVAQMFGRIAPRYDLMNTLMTLGQDTAWRAYVADLILDARTVLDVGTGTGKLALAIQARSPGAHVVGVDFSEPMLRNAPRALPRAAADALRLPFADAQFEAVVSAFLLRNVADVQAGIAEQVRVLSPGGTLVIL
jgi:demethylmenaquinone methyltransferase / 2-methoxy-6-polyprenyl-1,4-benzoquinol methylase